MSYPADRNLLPVLWFLVLIRLRQHHARDREAWEGSDRRLCCLPGHVLRLVALCRPARRSPVECSIQHRSSHRLKHRHRLRARSSQSQALRAGTMQQTEASWSLPCHQGRTGPRVARLGFALKWSALLGFLWHLPQTAIQSLRWKSDRYLRPACVKSMNRPRQSVGWVRAPQLLWPVCPGPVAWAVAAATRYDALLAATDSAKAPWLSTAQHAGASQNRLRRAGAECCLAARVYRRLGRLNLKPSQAGVRRRQTVCGTTSLATANTP